MESNELFSKEKQLHRLRIEIHGYEKKKNELGREESAGSCKLKTTIYKTIHKDPRYSTRNSIQKESVI